MLADLLDFLSGNYFELKSQNNELVFEWKGDYDKSFNMAANLPKEDFIFNAIVDSESLDIFIPLWQISDDKLNAKLIGYFADEIFIPPLRPTQASIEDARSDKGDFIVIGEV